MRTKVAILSLAALMMGACSGATAGGGGGDGGGGYSYGQQPTTAVPSASSVTVSDQDASAGQVHIDEIQTSGPSWIVIHTQSNGGPGPVIGYSPVPDGRSTDVTVDIDASAATPVLYAMLHTDAGTVGMYEFPGADVPVAGDQTNVPFNVTLAAQEPQVSEGSTVDVDMRSFAFSPRDIVVHAGTTVRWTNFDSASHSTTSDDGVWDSGLFGQGENFSFAFETPGVYLYHCTAHGGPGGAGMSGQVTVIP